MLRHRNRTILFLLLGYASVSVAAAPIKVPEGFVIEHIAGEPLVKFPMFGAFDERGRLFVAESSGLDLYAELRAQTRKCRMRLLEDRDGDGFFERSTIFADRLVFPMGLVWREEKLYVADPPDMVILEDTDEDGRADRRTAILTGFGHLDNGSLHGLIFGPDGWLYLTMGSPDGFRLRRRDGAIVEGQSGALLRCRADGTDVEVVCRGFENLVEVAFTPRGDMIGTDNWFQRPEDGLRDAFVHLVEGGVYPLNLHDPPSRYVITGDPLPAMSIVPAVALSGLVYYRGDDFPETMQGNLFSAQHNARKVGRHVLRPEGSTYQTEDFDFVTSEDPDFHPSDVLESADGSLLVIDTGGWYVQHCPTGRIRDSRAPGGIYRVFYRGPSSTNARRKPDSDDPWGQQIRWSQLAAPDFVHLLEDSRPAVRDRAQRSLASKLSLDLSLLTLVLERSTNLNARLAAVWVLAALPQPGAQTLLRRTLRQQTNSALLMATSRALASKHDQQSEVDLEPLLRSLDPAVRLAAAQALTHCGAGGSVASIWRALAEQPDPFLEHALIYAAHHLADERALNQALDHPHPRVQKAALILLDQRPASPRLSFSTVVRRAGAEDLGLRRTALRVMANHPEWAEAALTLVNDWFGKTTSAEASWQEVILAYQTERVVQEWIGEQLSKPQLHNKLLFLIELVNRSRATLIPASWRNGLSQLLDRSNPEIQLEVVRTAAKLQLLELGPKLSRLGDNSAQPADLRMAAYHAVASWGSPLSDSAVDFLIEQLVNENPPLRRLTAAEILSRTPLNEAQVLKALRQVRSDALIFPSFLFGRLETIRRNETAGALLDEILELLRNGATLPQIDALLDKFPGALSSKVEQARRLIQSNRVEQRAKLLKFEPLLPGGDAEKGRLIFVGMKTGCAACHRIGQSGGRIGPDLTNIGAVRSGPDLLESILFPSSTLAQGYETFRVATEQREFVGMLAEQDAQLIVLRDLSGAEFRLHRDQIRSIERQGLSLMPEGLEQTMTAEEFRDLLAFLKSLK